MKIIIAILIFSFIIIFHELGHFLVAKKCNVKVNEFTLGLGPTLLSWGKGETKYCIKLLPFGGACMMEGEDSESDSDRAFNKKPLWQRFLIVFAGPFFNFVLAYIISVILVAAVGVDKPVISEVIDGYPAKEAGLEAGDTIVALNGYNIHFYNEVSIYNFFNNKGKPVTVKYLREGDKYETTFTPKFDEERNAYMLGIKGGGTMEKVGPFSTLAYGVYEIKEQIYVAIQGVKMLVTNQISMQEVSGPVGVVAAVSDTYEQSASYGIKSIAVNMLSIMVLLSANLGVMNLLPIPALDGGRIFIYLIEAVRRKKMKPEIENGINLVGFGLLMLLMLFVMYNDITKLM
ncbi:MAG: RIP metalloprotease RseP [Pseudobutyrivibrio sp.]|nr:RIP metalloprotease RseP [Pseudobutyrivibrio sp.]